MRAASSTRLLLTAAAASARATPLAAGGTGAALGAAVLHASTPASAAAFGWRRRFATGGEAATPAPADAAAAAAAAASSPPTPPSPAPQPGVATDAAVEPQPVTGGGGGSASAAAGASSSGSGSRSWMEPVAMTPSQVVTALDAHIIGQADAKRAIAVALRNRWRRLRLPSDLQDEVIPKNILMVGPTGCGKTEIARRLAKLCRAPFVKVEATKFTEVGYHGRDVDTIIKDLMDASLLLVKELKSEAARKEVGPAVEARIIEALTGPGAAEDTVESFRTLLRAGALDDREIVVDVPVKERAPSSPPDLDVSVAGLGGSGGVMGASIDLGEFMQRIMPGGGGAGGLGGGRGGKAPPLVRRTMKVSEARAALEEAEVDKRLAAMDLRKEAVT